MEKTIVIADDNVAYLEETQRYFQNVAGYRVVGVAKDGMEAISLVEKNNPDFLLLDIVMPELDGFAVLSAIACSDFRPTVIMISQLSGEGFVSKSLAKGASYYMMKPIKYDKLKEVMDDFSQDSFLAVCGKGFHEAGSYGTSGDKRSGKAFGGRKDIQHFHIRRNSGAYKGLSIFERSDKTHHRRSKHHKQHNQASVSGHCRKVRYLGVEGRKSDKARYRGGVVERKDRQHQHDFRFENLQP